jgi:2-polyprenyl-3-methyl-5-hydroxy-6-metoxy-1,4-benzoquinol methylase
VEETAARAAAFPIWHFDFDLDGYRTEPSKAEWQNLRAAHFMRPLVEHYGGTLEGKRVLDLGCNAGFFSLTAIEAGCDFVLGIDGRQTHIDQANLVFEVKGVDPSRYRFECGNILDFDYRAVEPFDVVLCLGVLYHIHKPTSLLERIAEVNTDVLIIDTKAVIVMAKQAGYQDAKMLAVADHEVLWKWREGIFTTFACTKQSELSANGAFRFRSLSSLYAAQGLALPKRSHGRELRERLFSRSR